MQATTKKQAWGSPSLRRWKPVRTEPKRPSPARHSCAPELRLELNVGIAERKTLLWIDDYEPGLEVYKAIFEGLGFRVLAVSRGSVGLKLIASHHVDAVIVDYDMPEMDGEAVATSIRHSRPELPVIMFSGCSLVPNRVRNIVDAVCDKAGSRDELLAAINGVLGTESSFRPVVPADRPDHGHGRSAVA